MICDHPAWNIDPSYQLAMAQAFTCRFHSLSSTTPPPSSDCRLLFLARKSHPPGEHRRQQVHRGRRLPGTPGQPGEPCCVTTGPGPQPVRDASVQDGQGVRPAAGRHAEDGAGGHVDGRHSGSGHSGLHVHILWDHLHPAHPTGFR